MLKWNFKNVLKYYNCVEIIDSKSSILNIITQNEVFQYNWDNKDFVDTVKTEIILNKGKSLEGTIIEFSMFEHIWIPPTLYFARQTFNMWRKL